MVVVPGPRFRVAGELRRRRHFRLADMLDPSPGAASGLDLVVRDHRVHSIDLFALTTISAPSCGANKLPKLLNRWV